MEDNGALMGPVLLWGMICSFIDFRPSNPRSCGFHQAL